MSLSTEKTVVNTSCKSSFFFLWVVALVVTMFGTSLDAMANLNKFEANTRGEFGIASII